MAKNDNETWFWQNIVSPYIINKYNGKCADCGIEPKKFHLHHESQKEVTIKTIKPLCPKCHKARHKHN